MQNSVYYGLLISNRNNQFCRIIIVIGNRYHYLCRRNLIQLGIKGSYFTPTYLRCCLVLSQIMLPIKINK